MLGDAGALYGTVALGAGATLAVLALRLRRDPGDRPAKQLFGFSIVYLFAVLLLDVRLGPQAGFTHSNAATSIVKLPSGSVSK